MAGTDLSIVIVAYRCDQLLRACLESLALEEAVEVDVAVVDNASEATTRKLVESFAFTRYIDLGENAGFARANNFVLTARIGSTPVLLLNPDTVVPPGTLPRLLSAFERNPEVGMVGPKLVLSDGRLDHACKRGFPTPLASLAYFSRVDRIFPSHLGKYRASRIDANAEGEVDAINGAFMLVRSEALEDVGLLDERFWMYGEDLDWCYRFAQAGWKIRYVPLPVLHVKGGSSGRTRDVRTSWAFHRAMWIFYRKHHNRPRHLPGAGLVFLGVHGKFAFGAVLAGMRVVSRPERRLASGRI